jgi:hypothetical protein
VPERGIYENMKTAVDRVVRGKDRPGNGDSEVGLAGYFSAATLRSSLCGPT